MKTWIVIFLIGLVGASVIVIAGEEIMNIDRSITLDEDIEIILIERGADNYSYRDVEYNDYTIRDLESNTNFRLPTSPKFPTFYLECNRWNVSTWESNGEEIIINNALYEDGPILEEIFSRDPFGDNFKYLSECETYVRINYTAQENQDTLDQWETKTMDMIGRAEMKRSDESGGVVVREGEVIIGER